ncbi:uncharacterized protein YkwD [Microcella putealis]|uniref:Uncharacterized protein YkwD n=1 Tax=Microcella putealis TaxID=337005 RepID=A0A4V2EXD6_9MICO|nr:uncharacterized protein YkwD [Microcella putealis]TQM24146.1 uncharacterized protein YkwD [Microcella putealis]
MLAKTRAHPHNCIVVAARGVWASLAGVVMAAALVVVPVLAPAVAPAAHASESGTIHSLMNQGRAGAGLGPLARNPSLDQVALNWANQMAASGVMSHNPNYSTQIPAGWTRAGENVARGQASGAAMYDAWWNSAGHKANMLGDYTDVGIAFVQANGSTWGVQVFAKYGGSVPAPAPPPPPAPAPAPAPAPPPPPPPPPAEPAPAAEVPAPAADDASAAEDASADTPPPSREPSGDDAADDEGRAATGRTPQPTDDEDAGAGAGQTRDSDAAAASIRLAADGVALTPRDLAGSVAAVAAIVAAALLALTAALALGVPRRGAIANTVRQRFRSRNGNGLG